jgi:hypothetical protein
MDEETIYEFAIALVIIFGAFNYLYPGAAFFATLVTAVALLGVVLFVKGLLQYMAGNNKENIWAGAILVIFVIILYGGLPTVINAFGFIASFVLGFIDKSLTYLASIV